MINDTELFLIDKLFFNHCYFVTKIILFIIIYNFSSLLKLLILGSLSPSPSDGGDPGVLRGRSSGVWRSC